MKACKRREGIGGLEGKALQSQVQAHLGTRTQMYPKIFASHLDRLVIALTGFEAGTGKAVLAKGTGLEQHNSAFHWIGIHQRYADLVGADPVNQSRDVFGQSRTVALRVEIAQVGLQHAAVVQVILLSPGVKQPPIV